MCEGRRPPHSCARYSARMASSSSRGACATCAAPAGLTENHKATLPFCTARRDGDHMTDRSILGPADVDDVTFTGIVARALGEPPDRVTVLDSAASRRALCPGRDHDGRALLGHRPGLHARRRADRPAVRQARAVVEPLPVLPVRARGAASDGRGGVPWRTEALVYGSDLHRRLPAGLTMPVALHVAFLDEASAAVWLPALDVVDHHWDDSRLRTGAPTCWAGWPAAPRWPSSPRSGTPTAARGR